MSVAVEAEPMWATAEVVSVHLQMLGFPVTPATVRKWGSRGHIRADGPPGSRYDLVSAQEWAQGRDQRKWHLS